MFYYQFSIQFVSSGAPSFVEIKSLIEEAVETFNKRSLISRNRKQIIDMKIVEDTTLILIMDSSIELKVEHSSKSLRVFSTFLISEKTLKKYIVSGKLFKMIPLKLTNYEESKEYSINKQDKKIENHNLSSVEINELAIIEKFIDVIKKRKDTNYDKKIFLKLVSILNNR